MHSDGMQKKSVGSVAAHNNPLTRRQRQRRGDEISGSFRSGHHNEVLVAQMYGTVLTVPLVPP